MSKLIKKSNRNTKNDHKRNTFQQFQMNAGRTTKIRKNLVRKEKIQTKQQIPIPLFNRFSPMDIEDPVETTTVDSDKITTHIKTDPIKLQKRFNKNKIINNKKYQKQPNRK